MVVSCLALISSNKNIIEFLFFRVKDYNYTIEDVSCKTVLK